MKNLIGDRIGGALGGGEDIRPGGGVGRDLDFEGLGEIMVPLEDDAVDFRRRAQVHHDPLGVAGGTFPAEINVILPSRCRGDVRGGIVARAEEAVAVLFRARLRAGSNFRQAPVSG